MSDKRLFKSSVDFTRDVVQIELLVIDGQYFVRNYDRIVVNGKFKKAKRKWVKLGITDLEFKRMCKGYRGDKVYKIQYENRFLYASKVNPMIGETLL